MGGLLKVMVSSTAVILLACAAAVFLVPPVPPARMARRHAQARQFVERITEAVWAYHREKGEFPPGDGNGSEGLARALGRPSNRGDPYIVLPPEMVTPTGDIRNPLAPETSILHYRRGRHPEGGPAGSVFDLWCPAEEGWEIRVSDWAPAVSPP